MISEMAFQCQRPTWDKKTRPFLSAVPRLGFVLCTWPRKANLNGEDLLAATITSHNDNVALKKEKKLSDNTTLSRTLSFPLEKTSSLRNTVNLILAHQMVRFVALGSTGNHVVPSPPKSDLSSWEINEHCKDFLLTPS